VREDIQVLQVTRDHVETRVSVVIRERRVRRDSRDIEERRENVDQ
jgi:hypothetical protein